MPDIFHCTHSAVMPSLPTMGSTWESKEAAKGAHDCAQALCDDVAYA